MNFISSEESSYQTQTMYLHYTTSYYVMHATILEGIRDGFQWELCKGLKAYHTSIILGALYSNAPASSILLLLFSIIISPMHNVEAKCTLYISK